MHSFDDVYSYEFMYYSWMKTMRHTYKFYICITLTMKSESAGLEKGL